MDFRLEISKRIPKDIRDIILTNDIIEGAVNSENDPKMEYLFDVFEYFIDVKREYNNWNCNLCRDHILLEWKLMRPYLVKLQNENS